MDQDLLTSIYSAAADIQRLVLLTTQAGRLSLDRGRDIHHAAERIIDLNSKLGGGK